MKGITSINAILAFGIVLVIGIIIFIFYQTYIAPSQLNPNAGQPCVTADNKAGIYASDGVTCVSMPTTLETKYYTCADGSKVLWCTTGTDNIYRCIADPASQCKGGCSWNPSSWGNCLSGTGCKIICFINPPWAISLGCLC